ncbi:basic proline-rich protein-like [Schistocerca piceifrons]|uniref:basic proline-rich protein-like n=1 Tax=Schistocerca piceifrons TaxID=274613 RepID=UPI001F5FE7B7|nr:basic proline-rich protein-like [Schistocerca piceifrons]
MGRGSPPPAPATAPSGVRWPRRAAAAGASRPPSVGSVGTGLGLPPAFATPPTGGSAVRVGSGRQAASLAATVGVVIHGAAAPPVDAPKAARPADAPDGVVLVRSQTYTRRVSSALPAVTSSDARHSVSAQAGSAINSKAPVADHEWHVVTPRRDRRRAAGRRPPPPDRRRIIPPSPRNSGPARANAPGRPARATPRVSRAGGRARATAGPSVGGAANNSRSALGPSARPARATPRDARPARATPATPTTTAPSGSDRRAPSPRNSGPGRAGASGQPARATPRVSRAGGGPLATAGPSVGGAANTSRGAPDPSARPAQATPAPAATAAPPVTSAATESSTERPTPDGSTAPPPTQTTERRDVNGGTAAASPRTGSKKRRRRRRNNRPSPNLPPQGSRPTPDLTGPPVPSEQGATEAAPPPLPPADTRLTERQRRWLAALESVHNQPWDAFVAVVEDFISEIAETKPQRQAAGGRQDGPPAAAHRGQGRADAAANPPPPAPTRGRDAPAAVPDFAATTPPDVSEDVLLPITPSEVQQRLQKASNTAPGADGVTYSDLRREDPGCHVLAKIFSRCWNERKTPVQWKISTTVLIHKKGDVSDVTNWRPLALSSTISKLFAAIVADRTSLWAERLNLLSPEQKGFRTFEGCYEHNFIVQTAIDDARRRGGKHALLGLI